jgi:hypothetical protein
MKLTKLIVVTALLLGAAEFRAQADVGLNINITATLLVQSTNTFTNARTHTVTIAAPRRMVVTTADLLKRLAVAENNAGTFPTNKFPRGARLAETNGAFVVMFGTNILVDASNVISITGNGTNEITSGTTDTNGLARPALLRTHLSRINYDDTGLNTTNGLRFFLEGIVTDTTVDSAVGRNGVYTETRVISVPTAAGEGEVGVGSGDERAAIASGALSAVGSARLTLPQ